MSAHVAGPAVRRPPVGRAVTGLAWRGAAVAGMATAGLLHLVTAGQHAPVGGLVVGFFLMTAAAQLGVAAWLTATGRTAASPRLLLLAVAGTAVLLLLYLVAHTSTLLVDLGLVPVGHDAGAHGAGHEGAATGHAVTHGGPVAMGGEPPAAPEPATPLGTVTVAAEVLALGGLLALLPERWRSRAVDVLAATGLTVWLLWFTGVLS